MIVYSLQSLLTVIMEKTDTTEPRENSANGTETSVKSRPRNAQYGFLNDQCEGDKLSAVCRYCSKTITEKTGVTTAFNK